MTQVHILAIDLAKRSFQVCGTDRGGAVLFNRLLSRARLQQLLNEQSPCIVAMEACATSHSGAALLSAVAIMYGKFH
jgi:transposase